MKQTIITILLALVAVAGQGQSINWKLEGTVKNAAPTDTLSVIDMEKQRSVATLLVRDGKIVPTSGTLDEPAVCGIAKEGRRGWIIAFVIEEGTVNISIDLEKGYVQQIGGTPVNNELAELFREQNSNNSDQTSYNQNMFKIVSGIVEKHPGHIVSPFLISLCKSIYTPSESLDLIAKLSPELQASLEMERLKESLTLVQETEEGKMFKELAGETPDGKPTALSDFVGRGNYVLTDFWASWCGPCKEEIPYVIKLYEKYKDKGLKVIGITVSDTPEKSDSIVKQMGITFPQIYKSTPMSIYGVTAIPHTILFAPDGKILKRGLRGENIEKELEKIFGE